jgi:membrane protease subunit (stomatin/prohibitin family)
MGIIDFIKGEFIDVIEWTDDSRDTLSYRYPDEDKAIKNGAQLIVRESQTVQFMYLGQFGDTFSPGKYSLTTDNIPVLTKLKSTSTTSPRASSPATSGARRIPSWRATTTSASCGCARSGPSTSRSSTRSFS